MTDVSISRVLHHDVDTCAGGGRAAPGLAAWLGLAAAPTFAIMALWSAFFSGQPDMLCMTMQGSSPMGGMTVMYLLMSAAFDPKRTSGKQFYGRVYEFTP
jgi:hypothetical protein